MSPTKVLMVEDDYNWLKIFQILVGDKTKELFEYVHVSDLKTAIAVLQQDQFGMILLDLLLPDSYALNTIQVVTSAAKYIPIVIITTLDDEKLIHDAFVHGIEDYLVKDKYDVDTFIHACRRAIQRFCGKIAHAMSEDIKKLVDYLQNIDTKLENWCATNYPT